MSKNPWSYELNYEAEIALDEARIAYLSSEFAIKTAAAVEELIQNKAWEYIEGCQFDTLLYLRPELAEVFGLSGADVRAIFEAKDMHPSTEAEAIKVLEERYGPSQEGDYRRGVYLWEKALCIVPETSCWGEWRAIRETGKRGRAELLKHAKATLSRHRRNREKYGR